MTDGFPAGVGFTPIPNPILSSYLEEIDDLAELKVMLRALWLFHRKKGSPRPLRADELWADRTVASALRLTGPELEDAVRKALDGAASRGVLIRSEVEDGAVYFLNTAPERRAAGRLGARVSAPSGMPLETRQSLGTRPDAARVVAAYEENIGALTARAGELLDEALEAYPTEWIVDAIAEAVAHNARNWSFVSKILERWSSEGRRDGKPGRHSEALRSEEFLQAYQQRLRARGNR